MASGTAGEELAGVSIRTDYRTGSSDLVADFYLPCLTRSTQYDRAVGYFRSSIYALVGEAMIEFARKGGRMRLICSPELELEDVEAITRGLEQRKIVQERLLRDLALLRSVKWAQARLELLATLVGLGALDIRLALRPDAYGIYHEKLGVFRDGRDSIVSFIGSSNETQPAWHPSGNYEAFEVFPSWLGGTDRTRALRHAQYFDDLWNGDVPEINIVPPGDTFLQELRKHARQDLEALSSDLKAGDATRKKLQPHQEKAIQEWLDQNCRGILQHATGSGKTITALGGLRAVDRPGLAALILVPSVRLLRQWESEIRREMPEYALLIAGDGRSSWKRAGALRHFTSANRQLPARIVLCTVQTASMEAFRREVSGGDHLLLIADEVHQVGSEKYSDVLTVNAGKRLGLSATPERYGDPTGSQRLMEYFGPILPTRFTLRDAIEAKRLVPYEYFPHTVGLTDTEADSYRKLSLAITRLASRRGSIEGGDDRLKALLIKRARIAKSAAEKIPLAVDVIRKHWVRGQRWLVYCEDQKQMTALRQGIASVGLVCSDYHTRMVADSEATLEWLSEHSGILLSIRCLDEGVDLPLVSHALIIASSQNPRQFIQRRGRVLRSALGKSQATIHDILVVPDGLASEAGQVSLARSEILRALEFSRDALNGDAYTAILNVAAEAGIDTAVDTPVEIEE